MSTCTGAVRWFVLGPDSLIIECQDKEHADMVMLLHQWDGAEWRACCIIGDIVDSWCWSARGNWLRTDGTWRVAEPLKSKIAKLDEENARGRD